MMTCKKLLSTCALGFLLSLSLLPAGAFAQTTHHNPTKGTVKTCPKGYHVAQVKGKPTCIRNK